ncbi:unnamed protein product [Clavelina lepadiformis]|uniref:Uncharacterized protein n=1 Tax=Clavelina lepadiformis TaxID=159417 RepID=A0ABP0G9X2_CLALP
MQKEIKSLRNRCITDALSMRSSQTHKLKKSMDSENVSRLYEDLEAALTRAKAFTIKKEGASPRVDAKINGIYLELLDAYLSQGDIADGNLER